MITFETNAIEARNAAADDLLNNIKEMIINLQKFQKKPENVRELSESVLKLVKILIPNAKKDNGTNPSEIKQLLVYIKQLYVKTIECNEIEIEKIEKEKNEKMDVEAQIELEKLLKKQKENQLNDQEKKLTQKNNTR